ncbi:hypothetical protein J1792_26250 [Streptomyces triculaminicus]|uniref:Uncharacterized protein n=2 Tax=Streptomyces TaxID=1883 RepID=A0A939FSQ4_9ACTN|nr:MULTISPECIES: hypothetical protein [Streptomyces]MBO0656149.1 hypothetical protein [Streptomyces triculaminicus]QSY50129.1 hypothetical protein J3S04_03455 [Streptomyces griseocarneus]
MDTKDLARAYEELLAAVEAFTARGRVIGDADRTAADWLLTHIALTDRMLTRAARALMAGEKARVDNDGCMSREAIAAAIASSTHAERVATLRHGAAQLLELVGRMPWDMALSDVAVRLVDRGGREVFAGELKWVDVITVRTHDHLPGHVRALRQFVANRV